MEPPFVKRPQLISLYAPVMQSGKSEVAEVLCEQHGFVLVKFADPVKDMTRSFLRMAGAPEALCERMLEGDLKEQVIPGLGKSTRHLLQTLGTDWGRDRVSANVWVNLTVDRLRHYLRAGRSVVIDDMRFPNELEAVLAMGGVPVKIIRRGVPRYNAHPSEGLLDNYPMATTDNSGTLGDLRYTASILPQLLEE